MRHDTVADKIRELTKPKQASDKPTKLELLADLPAGMPAPLINNERGGELAPGHSPRAWLSWSAPSYDPDKQYDPLSIIGALEAAGWALLPACLVKRDNYRHGVEWGFAEEQPEEKKGYRELADVSPIMPAWVNVGSGQYDPPEVLAFMRSPSGNVYKVSIDVPAFAYSGCSVHARRAEYRGGWRYVRQSVRLHMADAWHDIRDENGETIANRCARSFARTYGDAQNPTALEGRIYWDQIAHDEGDFPLGAAQIVTFLLDSIKPA